ncbi:Uncharacterised protein [Mycobacterium tuberculosis]|uniref:Uncharacterized protein n=1 Tax=Mycobacterium tuberculosis TaxID=1773 RepID=A0A655AYJ7_MYCTX|nr:Uncharacterised protein [Mycobacterium tuberculosis]
MKGWLSIKVLLTVALSTPISTSRAASRYHDPVSVANPA